MRAAIPVRIAGTASFQPGPAYTTAELAARVTPPRDPADAIARTGITSRHFAPAGSRAVELGADALRAALASAALRPESLRRLIFVSSVGGDQIAPANANLIAGALGLSGSCDCFDLNNACMGFLTALDLGARSVATGAGPVGIVVVELLSRYTAPEDPRPYLVLADAVAAVVLDTARADEGLLASWLRNDARAGGDIVLENGGLTGRHETFRFAGSNRQIHDHALDAIRRSADAVLSEAGLGVDAVEWVLPHQPNGSMLAAIMRELRLDPERVVQLVGEVGSVGAASIATSLDRLLRTRPVRAGDRVLMVGVGAGVSYGAALLRLGSVTMADTVPIRVWVAVWRAAQFYFRYTVEGLDKLVHAPASLIVGYHGRPVAWDPAMLTVALYDELGYLPHGFLHRGVDAIPPLHWFADGLGYVTRDDPRLKKAVDRGEHLIVTPGGANEGCRSARHNYRVDWDNRVGYVKIAAKYRLPIVPVAASGVDDAYFGVTDANAIGRRLGLPKDWTWVPWLGLGPLGVFPFSPPFPARVHQLIGDPIEVPRIRKDDDAAWLAVHKRVRKAMQQLMDRARERAANA